MDGRRTTKRQYSEYSNFVLTQREPEYDQDTDLHQRESTQVRWGGRDGRCEPVLAWGTSRTTGRGGNMNNASIWTQSVSGQNSRRTTHAEREVGQPAIGYLKRRIDTETAGGISHGSGSCLRPMDQMVRRSIVTLRRATQTGLQMWSTQKD